MNTRAATTSEPTPKAFGAALYCVTCRKVLRVGDSAPMRAWAEKTFATPTTLAAFEEWVATVPAAGLVQVGTETGSGAGDEGNGGQGSPSTEVHNLTLARAKDRGITYRQA